MADLDRPLEPGADALHGRERGRGIGEVVAQHDELVAAEAADRVGSPHAAGEAPGDLAQHLVADLVPERVVDQLVVIDVHEHDRDGPFAPAGRGEGLLGTRGEERAVRQTGERIVQTLMRELGRGVRVAVRGGELAGAARSQQSEPQQRADRRDEGREQKPGRVGRRAVDRGVERGTRHAQHDPPA
jgi:hypothetical protein